MKILLGVIVVLCVIISIGEYSNIQHAYRCEAAGGMAVTSANGTKRCVEFVDILEVR